MVHTPIGVLLMAYGTPQSYEQIESYYTDIRRGRPPTPELLAELVARYQAIGGLSPLQQITEQQVSGLQSRLGPDFKVYLGMKHTPPWIPAVVQQMHADGVADAIGLVMAPHYSALGVGTYFERAEQGVAAAGGPRFAFIKSWHLHPTYLQVLADRVQAALLKLPPLLREDAMLVFSAHSLPQRILAMGDPYPEQLRQTGETVARMLGITRFTFAWQSAGRTPEPWLGPDILTVYRDLAAEGCKAIVSCPSGFVSDHLEVLYDIDIEAQALAGELGVQLVRTASLNADPAFLDALADVVRQHVPGGRR